LADHCLPVQEVDHWKCGGSVFAGGCQQGANANGSCQTGHICRPVPSLRVIRGRWIASCAVFMLGLILIVFNASWRNEVLAPGPLSQQHAQIIHRENPTQRCATCHSAGNGGLADWCLKRLTGTSLGPTQSALCLKCHEKLIPSESALLPHSLPAAYLQPKTEAMVAEGSEIKQAGFTVSLGSKRHALECSACHREHHGNSPSLAALTDAQCQTCHQKAFHSFASGHPEFNQWPQVPHERIKFNHQTHAGKHFAEAKQEFACSLCHVDDPQKNNKLLASFEQSCAKCHQGKILASTQEGIPFLAIPTLDVAAIRKAGHKMPPWPAAADGDFDGKMPWPMRLLLTTDAEAGRALSVLGDDSDFANLQSNRPEHLAAAAAISRGIHRLWNEIATQGNAAIEERMQSGKRRVAIATNLSQGLGPESLSAVTRWLGATGNAQAARESNPIALASFAEGPTKTTNPLRTPPVDDDNELLEGPAVAPPMPKANEAPALPETTRQPIKIAPSPRGIWVADDTTLTLRYFPTGHADRTVAAWLDVSTSAGSFTEPWTGQFNNPKAQGLCLQCHQKGNEGFAWNPAETKARSFTKFSHRPHLIQPQLADCSHCHKLNSPGPQFVGQQPSPTHATDFVPLQKLSCVQCHQASAAGDRCTQCHRYHVDVQALR